MICEPCKKGIHQNGGGCQNCWPSIRAPRIVWPDPECKSCGGLGLGCKGDTWCDCQHRTDVRLTVEV